MDVPTQAELIAKIESFCARHGMAESTFGREALNNSAFMSNLRGATRPAISPTLDTLNRLKAFMADKDSELGTEEQAA